MGPIVLAISRTSLLFVSGAVFVALLLAGGATAGAQRKAPAKPQPKPTTHIVTIDATSFKPASLTIKAGDTVMWINKDVIPHTATSKPGQFDSGIIATGKSWKQVVKTKGEFAYICTFHPTMKGTLRVR